MQTIYFTKRFDSGTLKGLSHTSAISFPDSSMAYYARKFRTGVTGRDIITKDRWTIVDASFQDYRR